MVVGEFTTETDLAIIGGGPGGYTAAFRAAELGVQTTIIDERDELGGVCLHAGCIPSKTLLHIAEVIRSGEHAAQFGITFEKPKVDLDRIRAWVDQTRSTLAKALAGLAKKHGVDVVKGRASFEDSRRLSVPNSDSPRIRFRRAIIATGAKAKPHPILEFDSKRILTAAEALEIPIERLGEPSHHTLIVGHNYNAVELACIYSALGSRVTLVDSCERMLPESDPDLSRPLLRRLREHLEHIACGITIERANTNSKGIEVAFAGGDVPKGTRFELAIVASEPIPNMDGLGLGKTSVKRTSDGFIKVDEQLHTTDPRILAIGDITGPPLLADHAMLQGRVAAEVVAGWNSSMDRRAVAFVIFTDPQLAWCGLTESEAQAQDVAHEVIKIPWGASGRAVALGRTDGVTKIIYDPDTKLVLGIGIAGVGAAEMIAEGVLAIEMGAVMEDLAGAIHPHPTLSELISGAAQRIEDTQ